METVRRDVELCHSQVLSFIDTLETQLFQIESNNADLDAQSSKLLNDIKSGVEEGLSRSCEELEKSLNKITTSMPELRQRVAAVREMRQTMEALLDKLSQHPTPKFRGSPHKHCNKQQIFPSCSKHVDVVISKIFCKTQTAWPSLHCQFDSRRWSGKGGL